MLRPFVAGCSVLGWLGEEQQAALEGEAVQRVAVSQRVDTSRDGEPPPSSVFMYVPLENFRSYRLAPISQYTAAALALGKCSQVNELAALRDTREDVLWGHIWEAAVNMFVLDALAAGGECQVRRAAAARDRARTANATVLMAAWTDVCTCSCGCRRACCPCVADCGFARDTFQARSCSRRSMERGTPSPRRPRLPMGRGSCLLAIAIGTSLLSMPWTARDVASTVRCMRRTKGRRLRGWPRFWLDACGVEVEGEPFKIYQPLCSLASACRRVPTATWRCG